LVVQVVLAIIAVILIIRLLLGIPGLHSGGLLL
jgi:hypothetical protein